MLFPGLGGRIIIIEGIVAREQKFQNFSRRGKSSVSCEEHINVRRLEFPVIVRQTLYESFYRSSFQETYPDGFPLQMRNFVVRVLSKYWKNKIYFRSP